MSIFPRPGRCSFSTLPPSPSKKPLNKIITLFRTLQNFRIPSARLLSPLRLPCHYYRLQAREITNYGFGVTSNAVTFAQWHISQKLVHRFKRFKTAHTAFSRKTTLLSWNAVPAKNCFKLRTARVTGRGSFVVHFLDARPQQFQCPAYK